MSCPQTWPYPDFGHSAWLSGDGRDPALQAVRTAVRAVLAARGQNGAGADSVLAGLTALVDLEERIDWALLALAGEARSLGVSWAALGQALGTSRQAAHQRYGPWIEQALAQAAEPVGSGASGSGHDGAAAPTTSAGMGTPTQRVEP